MRLINMLIPRIWERLKRVSFFLFTSVHPQSSRSFQAINCEFLPLLNNTTTDLFPKSFDTHIIPQT